MNKLLQKTRRDEIKEGKCFLGSKRVLRSLPDSKLVVLSRSAPESMTGKIIEEAGKHNVHTLNFSGTSVALGRMCGLLFRVSAVSFNSLAENSVKSIINESETE